MAFIDKISDIKDKLSGKALGGLFNGADEQTKAGEKLGVVTEWFFSAPLGIPRGLDIKEIRSFGKSNFVRMIIDTIIKEVDQTDWRVVPKDNDDVNDYSSEIIKTTQFLNNPNRNKDTFSELVKPMLRDLLEIDAGVWVKVYDEAGELVELWCRDGGSFLKKIDYRGVEEKYFQYSWRNPLTRPIEFEPEEVVYFMNNPSSYHIYGFSPLQSIQQIIEMLIQSTRFNKEFFSNNAIPDGIFSLVNANRDTLQKFEGSWLKNLKGKAHKLGFINSEIAFEKFNITNKDMEWLEGTKLYMNVAAAAYGVSMSELGFSEDVNKASQAGQERVTVRNAIKPFFSLIEKHINLEIIPELLKTNPEDCPVVFKYFAPDHTQELEKQNKMLGEYREGLITKNEYRTEMGYDTVDEGDDFKQSPQMGLFGAPQDDDDDDKTETQEGLEERRKSISFKALREESNDMVYESKDYASWLSHKISTWETTVIRALEAEKVAEKDLVYVKKTFGNFVSRLFNAVNTATFYNGIKHFVKIPMKEGLSLAEDELQLDIPISPAFEKKAEFFAQQELNGYTLPDGKVWHGIKGATRELQTKILNEVRDGVISKDSQAEITKRVQEVFKIAKGSGAERIARTETNRFVNQGKLQGYIDSGLDGKKQWDTHLDDKTSPICKRLDGQKVDLSVNFVDPKTKKTYPAPPSHPNCRSSIRFIMDGGDSE